VLEPQSVLILLFLLAAYGVAAWWLTTMRRVIFKILAGALAGVPAVLLGIAAVNSYYGYYQDWSGLSQDLTGSADPDMRIIRQSASDTSLKRALEPVLEAAAKKTVSTADGLRARLMIHGATSGLTREVLIYLPPQYFEPAYGQTRFPVIDLLHGAPGGPRDWLDRMHVARVFNDQLVMGEATAAVLVIPDTNEGNDRSLQCLNVVGGPQDESFLVDDLSTQISGALRVQPPGRHWGVAGFSEGGYCAANLALRHPNTFGAAGVMSGYFSPMRLVKLPAKTDPFAGDPNLRAANSPMNILSNPPTGAVLPHLWVMAGTASGEDMTAATQFVNLARQRRLDARFTRIPGGAHTFPAWRQAMPQMLIWITRMIR
jgi:enterochelin esterase-like enzyme